MPKTAVGLVAGQLRSRLSVLEKATFVAQRFGALLSSLLGPLSLIAYVFAAWRLAGDIGFSAPFAIRTGLFSHWIVWLSIGSALSVSASILKGNAGVIAASDDDGERAA